jgi:hypothetical protein
MIAGSRSIAEQPARTEQQYAPPVEVAQPISASIEEVWRAISMPGSLEPCHPFCARNPVSVWPGAESRDEVHYLNGRVFERRFVSWTEGVGYELEIGEPGGKRSFVSWELEPLGQEGSALSITVHPHPVESVPAALRGLVHRSYVRPMLKRYLSSVVRGFEWYVVRGEPVPRNQFGSHRWFS